MLPPGFQSPREATLYYDSVYDSLIDSGKAHPVLYPWSGIGAFVVVGYLLIDHRHSPTLKWLRYPLFVFLCMFQALCILTNKAKHPAASFGVGILSAWGVLWVGAITVANDCQTDFSRIERDDARHGMDSSKPTINSAVPNGTPKPANNIVQSEDLRSGTLYWQTYPASFMKRLDWVADVFCSFRGVGWNWQRSGVPRLPKQIESQLHGKAESSRAEPMTVSKTGIRRFSDRTSLLRCTVTELVIGYLVLDAIKTIMHNDPYFWGYTDAPPPTYLPTFVQHSHFLVKSYRLIISLAGIYTALGEIFKLGPLFFCGILGPRWIEVRGEAWMNPADMFGSFKCVLDQGLAGWWGGWWHQVFRFGFEAPAKQLLGVLEVDERSTTGKMISLFLAFFLSGCLHLCGSYTQLGDTRPLLGPLRFFLLQPFGILAQLLLTQQLSKVGILQKTPKLVKQSANLVFAHAWLYFTAPLLVDDFARGGIWLFEPIAISPLRGLGFGAKDDGWNCWWNGLLFWHSGKHWWDSGIAL